MKRISLILIPLFVCLAIPVLADGYHTIIKHDVEIRFETVSPESVKLYSVTNRSKDAIKIKLDGNENPKVLKPGQTREYGGVECRLIQAVIAYGSCTILNERILNEYLKSSDRSVSGSDVADKSGDTIGGDVKKTDAKVTEPEIQAGKKSDNIQADEKPVVSRMKTVSEKEPEFRKQTKAETKPEENPLTTEMKKESEFGKQAKVETKQVQRSASVSDGRSDVEKSTPSRNTQKTESPSSLHPVKPDATTSSGRQDARDIALENSSIPLTDSMGASRDDLTVSQSGKESIKEKHLRNPLVYLLIILAVAVVFVLMSRRRRGDGGESVIASGNKSDGHDGEPVVILQRSHDIILKRQSLDDVRSSGSYFLLDSRDFCHDSAVRRIYLKNSCIKDIYDMYADDLRNPDKPDEDGCMVLGRWVMNPDGATYDISMEYVVRPGDDAVFQEYELNFGGKIKMKVSEKLRKLRRDTDLQYDLTCWVHSHPGLGVFFSNYDSSVQMQLKHSVHPYFLTAIVVDILTPSQDFGIFSFKQDESITSRNDLTRLYSLEELYKWAVNSERMDFKTEDYYNILKGAIAHTSEFAGIELGNNSIIDICRLTVEHTFPSLYGIYGYTFPVGGKDEIIVQRVSAEDIYDGNELVGCLCTGTHCSIPTIRKTLSEDLGKYKFVLFYSSVDEELTVIPITDGVLVTDERYYTQNKLETLKLWTRRRR